MRLLLFLLPVFAFTRIAQEGDFQVWQRTDLKISVYPTWEFDIVNELRWGNNASLLYFQYAEILSIWKFPKWGWIAPAYRQEFNYHRDQTNAPTTIYIPFFDIGFQYIADWKVFDRNRGLFRMPHNGRNHWQYRNRFEIHTPTYEEMIYLFVFDEVFFTQYRGFNQNRAAIGLGTFPVEHSILKIFYIRRDIKPKSGWRYENVLELQLVLEF